jgi:hypothetical protein
MRWRLLVLLATASSSFAAWCVLSLPAPDDFLLPDSSLDGARQLPMMQHAIERRYQAVDDLLAGRKTVADTVACFRAIAHDDPADVRRGLQLLSPEISTEEDLFFMQVCHYAQALAQERRLDASSLQPLRDEAERRQTRNALSANIQ